jgi:hypothetical protein
MKAYEFVSKESILYRLYLFHYQDPLIYYTKSSGLRRRRIREEFK